MSFEPKIYKRFIAAKSPAQQRLIRQYKGTKTKFDIVIVGSGVGGGVLADALAQLAKEKNLRILVLEAGSFLYPTHVYNLCRFLNHRVAKIRLPDIQTARRSERGRQTLHRRANTVELRWALHLLVRINPQTPTLGAQLLPPEGEASSPQAA